MPHDDARAELLRAFAAVTSGAELADLRALDAFGGAPPRPELRRPPRDAVTALRIRIDLDDTEPPIWRRLEVRSDITLALLHRVIQAAFGWGDTHPHRFALGGGPIDREPGGGAPTADARIDQVLQERGDMVRYVYRHGDGYALTIRLELVLDGRPSLRAAQIVNGQRAAPPDHDGSPDAARLPLALADPTAFDIDAVEAALRDPFLATGEGGLDPRLVDIARRISYHKAGDNLTKRLAPLITQPTEIGGAELARALRAPLWFVERAADGGVPLTDDGYLRPADVEAASEIIPAMWDWMFAGRDREALCMPLLNFRRVLQSSGVLRKYKGQLVPTRVGLAGLDDPSKLWEHLASRLIPKTADRSFGVESTLLLLAFAGASPRRALPQQGVTRALSALRWRRTDGRPLNGYGVHRLPAYTLLTNIGEPPVGRRDGRWISAEAATLARAALRRG